MLIEQKIFFANKHWSILREHSWAPYDAWGLTHCAESLLLICPWCGETWARLQLPSSLFYSARMVPCEHHAVQEPFGPVPGSMLTEEGIGNIDTALLNALPPELIEREFYLHVKTFTEELNNDGLIDTLCSSRS